MLRTGIFTVAIALLFSLPATAQLGQLWSDFQLYTVGLQEYFKDNIAATLQPMDSETASAIDASKGVLNIPNPIFVNQTLNNDILINSLSDSFENNSIIYAQDINSEIYRLITRGRVAAFLEPDAQNRLKGKLESTENAIKTINESTSEATEKYQNLLTDVVGDFTGANAVNQLTSLFGSAQSSLQLQTIKIQGEQAKMVGELLGQSIDMGQSLQYSNLNLASISQQMEQVNRARRIDSSAEAARLLRNTAQSDLLGRESVEVREGRSEGVRE
jgi:hypothetical protein